MTSTTSTTTTSSSSRLQLKQLLKEYPLSDKQSKYDYGTAGFRYPIQVLDGIMIRVGIILVLRGISSGGNSTGVGGNNSYYLRFNDIGCMITASHNTIEYNGVKIIDVNGGMLHAQYEKLAFDIANIRNISKLIKYIQTYLQTKTTILTNNGNTTTKNYQLTIHVGHDTRYHSPKFTNLIIKSVQAMQELLLLNSGIISINIHIKHHGVVTTPLLHHLVLHHNHQSGSGNGTSGGNSNYNSNLFLPLYIPPSPSEYGYYNLLAYSYINLLRTITQRPSSSSSSSSSPRPRRQRQLVVDCACGVGYYAVQQLQESIRNILKTTSSLDDKTNTASAANLVPRNKPNDDNDGRTLNEQCGSEYVQKSQHTPKWWDTNDNDNEASGMDVEVVVPYGASIDGDADRIVFFANNGDGNDNGFILLDGDQIACLICKYLQELITILSSSSGTSSSSLLLSLGVVQTAYANGASTTYLQQCLGVENVKIAKTGVKYVHHMAEHSNLDISVYFEANGHGTVLFDTNKITQLSTSRGGVGNGVGNNGGVGPMTIQEYAAWEQLRYLPLLINPAVGDAMSDLLFVDFILQYMNDMSLQEWKNSLYKELPSKQLKVAVPDRKCLNKYCLVVVFQRDHCSRVGFIYFYCPYMFCRFSLSLSSRLCHPFDVAYFFSFSK